MQCIAVWTMFLLVFLISGAIGITNTEKTRTSGNADAETAEYTEVSQFQPYNQQLTRGLSQQQQSQILNDIQQHRFQVPTAQRNVYNFDQQYNHPQFSQENQFVAGQYNQQASNARPLVSQQQQFFDNPQYNAQYLQQQRLQYNQQQSRPTFSQEPVNNQQPFYFQQNQNNQQSKLNYQKPAPQTHNGNVHQTQSNDANRFVASPQYNTQTLQKIQQNPSPLYSQPNFLPTASVPAQPRPTYVVETQPSFLPTVPQPSTAYKTDQPIFKEPKVKPTAPTTTTTLPPSTTKHIPYRLRYKLTSESPKEISKVTEKVNQLQIKPERQKLFQQLLEAQQSPAVRPQKSAPASRPAEQDVQDELQKHIQQQLQKEGILQQYTGAVPATADQLAAIPDLNEFITGNNGSSLVSLANGQKIKIIQVPSKLVPGSKKPSPQIKTIVINQPVHTTTIKPPTVLFEELTKSVLPPGANYELIRQKQDGGLEEIGRIPQNIPQKRVTFVILEEQPDGTVKVQGVRGNENEAAENGGDVDSIIKKLQQGEIKLPPSAKLSPGQRNHIAEPTNATPEESISSPAYIKHTGKVPPKYATFIPTPVSQPPNFAFTSPKYTTSHRQSASTTPTPKHQQYVPTFRGNPTNNYPTESTVANSHAGPIFSLSSNPNSNNAYISQNSNNQSHLYQTHSTTPRSIYKPSPTFLPTLPPKADSPFVSTNSVLQYQDLPSTTSRPFPSPVPSSTSSYIEPSIKQLQAFINANQYQQPQNIFQQFDQSNGQIPNQSNDVKVQHPQVDFHQNVINQRPNEIFHHHQEIHLNEVTSPRSSSVPQYTPTEAPPFIQDQFDNQPSGQNPSVSLNDILRKQGLFAMSKFLRQSGLDSILNSTGPYTLFVPTDQAFRALLVQLGGPDKAEEKFQENPRLLSGLLLHHVIPGAFQAESLQDEMTGVSLAGTQLRVNTYTVQDEEWNDLKVLTINGAKVLKEKKDMFIPQGIAHAVDRVMFPLPVGDLLQTLQSDREGRFNRFLRVVQDSGVISTFTGTRTFTLFAPMDHAFTEADIKKYEENRALARNFVLRHLTPGTLYTEGLLYFQVRDSLDKNKQLTIYKEGEKIRVNSANVVTRNVPATNGVIHAIDSLL